MGNPAGYIPEKLVSDGSTTRLPFPFQTQDRSTVKVKVIAQDTGAYSYATVTSVEVTAGVAGGYANISVAATAGDIYVIYDDAPYVQDLNIQAAGDLRNDLWVKGLDKLSRQIQVLADESRRSIKFAIGETTVDGTFEGTVFAGRALVINDTADGIAISETSIGDIDAALATAEAQADAATSAAAASANSASAAASSATTAAAGAVAAVQSQLAASVASAAQSETNAASSATTAAGSASSAAASAVSAAASAASVNMPSPEGKGLQLLRANSGGTAPEYSGVTISTDGTLASNSDAKLATEKAVKTYADGLFSRLETRTSDPSSPVAGQMWLRTDL